MSKVSVMVSGGIDSFVAHDLAVHEYGADNVTALFLDLDQPYLEKEWAAVTKLIPSVVRIKADLCIEALDNIPTIDSQEIFGRNMLIGFYGALASPLTWMAALETEMNPTAVSDKQPEFFFHLSGLMSFLMKGKRLQTVITSPFQDKTKSDIIADYLARGGDMDKIQDTTTCYNPHVHSCGECSTCFKRWIALRNNGIVEYTESTPWVSDYAKSIIAEAANEVKTGIYSGRYSKKRLDEMRSAFKGITGLDGVLDE